MYVWILIFFVHVLSLTGPQLPKLTASVQGQTIIVQWEKQQQRPTTEDTSFRIREPLKRSTKHDWVALIPLKRPPLSSALAAGPDDNDIFYHQIRDKTTFKRYISYAYVPADENVCSLVLPLPMKVGPYYVRYFCHGDVYNVFSVASNVITIGMWSHSCTHMLDNVQSLFLFACFDDLCNPFTIRGHTHKWTKHMDSIHTLKETSTSVSKTQHVAWSNTISINNTVFLSSKLTQVAQSYVIAFLSHLPNSVCLFNMQDEAMNISKETHVSQNINIMLIFFVCYFTLLVNPITSRRQNPPHWVQVAMSLW